MAIRITMGNILRSYIVLLVSVYNSLSITSVITLGLITLFSRVSSNNNFRDML